MHALPELVGVVGGGRMGAGIAHTFLSAGCDVIVREADPGSAQAAAARIEKSIRTAIQRGTVTETWPAVSSRLRVVTELDGLADRDLVVEAVPEIIELKADVLTAVEKSVGPACVLASNTSSLSIDTLAGALWAPQRFIGLHFFNPVPTSELVEIVNGARTDPELSADAVRWVNALGKQAVSVRDSPGFATSRLGVVIALEAMRMLEEGVASAEDIDSASGPTSSASTCVWTSPATWPTPSARGSRRRPFCANSSRRVTPVARPGAVSTSTKQRSCDA
jgi:3-hydroxybutyryl-CoA dehydrogenase